MMRKSRAEDAERGTGGAGRAAGAADLPQLGELVDAKHGIAVFTAIRDALTGNPLDATHPSQRLNHARNPSRTATQE